MPPPDAPPRVARESGATAGGPVFWKIAGAGAAFQAGSAAVDSATIVASIVNHLTGSVYAVGAASAVLRLGWLLPQLLVGFLAQRVERRMPYYVVGAFGRAGCLALIALLLAVVGAPASGWVVGGFFVLWTVYAFVSGIVTVPYNDIVGRSIRSGARSRMLAWRFSAGGFGPRCRRRRSPAPGDRAASHRLRADLRAGIGAHVHLGHQLRFGRRAADTGRDALRDPRIPPISRRRPGDPAIGRPVPIVSVYPVAGRRHAHGPAVSMWLERPASVWAWRMSVYCWAR